MFKIDDLVWYRGRLGQDAAIIVGHEEKEGKIYYKCRRPGWHRLWWGYEYQFSSRACHLCGAATNAPGCPLCPKCIKEQEEQEQDARDEAEQRRRPR